MRRTGARAAMALLLASMGVVGCDPIYLIEPSDEETATVHEGGVTADETWRKGDNPHKVVGRLVVAGSGSPTLTLEPGVTVLFERGASLVVGTDELPGALRAIGAEGDEIELMSEARFQSHGYWGALELGPRAELSNLEHVIIRDCGGTSDWPQACLRLLGGAAGRPTPTVRHVTVAFSSGFGIAAVRGAGFGGNSRAIEVLSTRSAVIRIDPGEVHTIPADLSIWNEDPRNIQIGGGALDRDLRWEPRGVPYEVIDPLTIGGPGGPVLTLAAGTKLRFGQDAYLGVGLSQPGGLVAEGTPENTIAFSAVSVEPRGWKGLVFGPRTLAETRLDNTVIAFGGYPSGFGSVANVTFLADVGSVIRNSEIRDSSGCGIARLAFDGPWETDFTAPALGNTFNDNHFGPQCTTD